MKKIVAVLLVSLASTIAFAMQPLPSNAAFDTGFSPDGSALNVVVKGIESARASILVAAYTFTSRPVATALLAAQRRGVKVAVIADRAQNSKSYSSVWFLANQGVPVRLNDRYQDEHNKFMVIDGLHLETGSFNYSAAAANKNAENAVLLWNVKPLAERYTAEWQRLWQESADLKPAY
ncbi:PLD-like domain-containing protein [Paraburkholderia phenazinium]|jgi:phosphatidylserine/phosphatidylglycerophosphate/cardiolipin synthase-like enzyme|uniref:phospholipase D n=2 Tax=Paraburkholderia phenazinium TaxID=60549 RepID=A0A1G7P630_9BURK|nr:PLD-like domain-containing protein [Paraburkholderia phenazinium]